MVLPSGGRGSPSSLGTVERTPVWRCFKLCSDTKWRPRGTVALGFRTHNVYCGSNIAVSRSPPECLLGYSSKILRLPVALVVKNLPDSAGGEGNGTLLQYSHLENPTDGGAWWAAVHGVAKSWTWLSDFTFTFHFHALEKEMATHSSVLAWRIPGRWGAWWTAVYGVAQSQTRLKWLSSSSSRQCRKHKRHRFSPWVGKTPWRGAQQHTPVFLPGESQGQRSLVG